MHMHMHAGEDGMFHLLEGESTGFCDDDLRTAIAGSLVFVPTIGRTASPSAAGPAFRQVP